MSNQQPEGRPDPYTVELILAAALAQILDGNDESIARAWAAAWAEVAADLRDALEVILAADGKVNIMAVVRYERLSQTLAVIADQLEDLAEQLDVVITEDLAEVLDLVTEGTQALVDAQLRPEELPTTAPAGAVPEPGSGRDTDAIPNVRPTPPDALAAIIERTTEQVTSLSKPLADDTYSLILRELTRGVAAGDNPREVAARMVERAEDMHNFGMNRALNIARTEILDAHRKAAEASQNANADILAGWVWLAHLGPRTCRSCLAQHGSFHLLEESGPYDHQQGRCSRTPVVKEADGSHDLSWVPSAGEHFESLPAADQEAILGKAGYQAWLAGEFPMTAWSVRRENDGWRDSYVPASPARVTRRVVA